MSSRLTKQMVYQSGFPMVDMGDNAEISKFHEAATLGESRILGKGGLFSFFRTLTTESSVCVRAMILIPYKSMAMKKRSLDPLSPVQLKVYQYLKDQLYSAGSMPTLREICKEMGWKAIGSAQDVIAVLIEKGFLKKNPNRARGLELRDHDDFRSVPILGSAPAGKPFEAIENHLGDIALPGFIRGPVFALRVQGDSMKNADIQSGDLVIVKQSETAEDGEIVVAVLLQEVTIKRLQKKRDQIFLIPENEKYLPVKVDDPSFRILGKVIGLHRYWEKI